MVKNYYISNLSSYASTFTLKVKGVEQPRKYIIPSAGAGELEITDAELELMLNHREHGNAKFFFERAIRNLNEVLPERYKHYQHNGTWIIANKPSKIKDIETELRDEKIDVAKPLDPLVTGEPTIDNLNHKILQAKEECQDITEKDDLAILREKAGAYGIEYDNRTTTQKLRALVKKAEKAEQEKAIKKIEE
jgi:hypothetical protein